MYIIFGWIVCRASYTTLNEDNLFAYHAYPVTLNITHPRVSESVSFNE